MEEILSGIPSLTGKTVSPKTESTVAAELTAAQDVREQLFRAFAAADCPLLELTPRIASLEEVFLELTRGGREESADGVPGEVRPQDEEGGGQA